MRFPLPDSFPGFFQIGTDPSIRLPQISMSRCDRTTSRRDCGETEQPASATAMRLAALSILWETQKVTK
jgi:hypothetical protein